METFTPKHGDFVVLKINEKCTEKSLIGYEAVYWVNDEFPLHELNSILENGYFEVRKASEIEKQYCYSAYDQTSQPSVDLDDMPRWLEWKQNQEGGKNG